MAWLDSRADAVVRLARSHGRHQGVRAAPACCLLGLPHQPVVGTGLLVDGGTSGPDLAQLRGVLLQLGVGAVELGRHRALFAGDQGFEFGDPRRSVIVQRTTDISATDYGH